MLNVNREGEETRQCFAEVSESRHSPLVLVEAPAQGSSALYGLILQHSVAVNHPQPLTTLLEMCSSMTIRS